MKISSLVIFGVLVIASGCVKQHPLDSNQTDKARINAGELVALNELKATYVVSTNNFSSVSPTSSARPELEYYTLEPSTYKAQTSGEVEPSGMSVVDNIVVSKDVNNIRFLDKVKFQTNAPLLKLNAGKVDFLGEPNRTYDIKYKLTPSALLMMKIISENEITHQELPYSDNLGNGTFAVPLGGYAAKPLRRKRVLNDDNDATNRFEYVPARLVFNPDGSLNTKCSTCADFIEIKPDDQGFQKFTVAEDKKDVYPADYFSGEWYFSEGVVNTKPGRETAIGFISGSFDADFRNASKIKFFRTASAIKGYNVAVDEQLDSNDSLNLSPVISIPAEGKNYELADSGALPQLAEIEVPNISIESAPYVKIHFEGLTTIQTIFDSKFVNLLGTLGTTSAGVLREVMFAKDSFFLTFEDVTNGRLLRYSFLKAKDRNYQARRHYKEDREIFGYFPTVRTRLIRDAEDYREEDFEKNILLQRHNPNQDVVFYFSDLTPKDNDGKCRPNNDDTLGALVDAKGEINYREIGRRAVKYWDSAFKVAGAPKGVKLHEVNANGECFDAPLGDLQYNSINMLDTIQATNLLGVGPSLVDPFSGEVINTTMNVHIAPFRSIVSREVREFLSGRLGLFKERSNRLSRTITGNSTILGESLHTFEGIQNKALSLIPITLRRYVAELYHFGQYNKNRDLSRLNTYGANNSKQLFDFYNAYKDFDANSDEVELIQLISDRILETDKIVSGERVSSSRIRTLGQYEQRLKLIEKYRPDFYRLRMQTENISALSSMNSMDKDIRERCPEVIAFVDNKLAQAKTLGIKPSITSAEENPIVKSCMNKIIPEKILATVVHEMGHNLGLRHNFYGSADPRNFFNRDEIKKLYDISLVSDEKLPQSSSAMEYIPSDKDRLYYPGHYDIAAIRYGYANQVEVESSDRPNLAKNIRPLTGNDQATKSGPEGNIINNQAEIGKIRNYKFCTDHQASLDFDPLCQRHDFGTNPKQIVEGLINDYYESLIVYGTRYDRASISANMARVGIMYRLKRFYDEYRYRLADRLGVGNEYLDKFDPASYQKFMAQLKNDTSFAGRDYLAVRDQIYNFLIDVAFLNNKYCVAMDPANGNPFFLELEKARIQVRSQAPEAIIADCEDEGGLVQKYIESLGLTYIGDIGFSLNDFKFKVDGKEAFEDALDVTGTFGERLLAGVFITERSQRVPGLLQKIQPNMLDEPDLYLDFENRVLNRILNGANLGKDISLLGQSKPELEIDLPEDADFRVTKFEAEGPLLNLMMTVLEEGVNNPFIDSAARSTKYGRFIDNLSQADIQSLREEKGLPIPVSSGRYLIIRAENTVSMALANVYQELSQKVGFGFFIMEQVAPAKGDLVDSTRLKLENAIADLPDLVADLTAEDYVAFGKKFYTVFDVTSEDLDYFEFSLANQIASTVLMPYNLVLKSIVDQIDARTKAGVDASDLLAELQKAFVQINADLPKFFASIEAAIQQQSQNPNIKLAIPSKQQMRQLMAQSLETTADDVFEVFAQDQRDFNLNQEEYMAHFRLLQGILLDQGGAELGAQLAQSALTRLDVSRGEFETPVQRFMARNFPDSYAKNMSFNNYVLKHVSARKEFNILKSFSSSKTGLVDFDPASFKFFN